MFKFKGAKREKVVVAVLMICLIVGTLLFFLLSEQGNVIV